MANGNTPDEDIFKPASQEELKKRREAYKPEAVKNIPKAIGKIKEFIVKLKYVDCMDIDYLRSSIEELRGYCEFLENEEDIRTDWKVGMMQMLERLVLLSNEVVIKYKAFIAELNTGNGLDKLIHELDERCDELDLKNK